MNTEATFCNNRSIGLTNDRPNSGVSSSYSSHSSSNVVVGVGAAGGGGGSSSSSTTRSSPTQLHHQQQRVPSSSVAAAAAAAYPGISNHRFGAAGTTAVGGGGGGGASSNGSTIIGTGAANDRYGGGAGQSATAAYVNGNSTSRRGGPTVVGGGGGPGGGSSAFLGGPAAAGGASHQALKTDAAIGAGAAGVGAGPETRRWVPPSLRPQHGLTQEAKNDVVFRTVRGILNKLTPENFQKLSDDLLKIDLNTQKILNGVILLVFEKAVDEQKYSSMYAQLCKRLSVEAPNFEEASSGAANGTKTGTFKNLLLNVCRDRFLNRNDHENIILAAAYAAGPDGPDGADIEEKLLIAKQKMLGNVKFIGELAKLDMLHEDKLHMCVQELLDKNRSSTPEKRCADLECLSQLLRTCGKNLDTEKGKVLMDQYFAKMEKYSQWAQLPLRIRFMLRDVIELRKRKWVPRKQTAEGPMPIDQLLPDDEHLSMRSPYGGGGSGGGSRGGGDGGGSRGAGGHGHGGGGGGGGRSNGLGGGGDLGDHYQHRRHQHHQHGGSAGDHDSHHWMNKMGSMSLSGGGHHHAPAGGSHGVDYGLSMTSSSHYSQPYNSSPVGGHYNNRDYRDGGQRSGGSGGSGGATMDYRHNAGNRNGSGYHHSNGIGGSGSNGLNGSRFGSGNGGGGGNKLGGSSHHNGYQSGGGANKDLAPRFKRNLISAASTAPVDPAESLSFRPAANSLLFKANANISAAQLPLGLQPRSNGPTAGAQSAGGQSPVVASAVSSNGLDGGAQRPSPADHQPVSPLVNSLNTPLVATPPAAAVSIASKLIPPQPINNLMKKDQILIKQASQEKPKQTKKDKGPFKEDVLKRVKQFVAEHFLVSEKADADAHESETKKADAEDATSNGTDGRAAAADDGAKQLAAFHELKVPEKFMRDTIATLLDEIVDKPDGVHERVFQLLVALRRDGKLPTAVVLDAFRALLKNDANIHPRIATHAAALLCRAVSTQSLLRIQDVAQLADAGQHYPLFLLVLQKLHAQLGKQTLLDTFNGSKVQLMATLPEPDRNKDRMAAILQDRGLSFLYPLLKLEGELQKQIEADANPHQLYKWIKENVDSTCYGDPGFITALMNVLLRYITRETTLADGVDRTRNPDKALCAREKQLLERYSPVLLAFLRDNADLELVAIYVLQAFCHAAAFPKNMLLRWFTALYDLNVVQEETFLRWREDLSDVSDEKGTALFQVNTWLTWLQAEDSEDEDDDDE